MWHMVTHVPSVSGHWSTAAQNAKMMKLGNAKLSGANATTFFTVAASASGSQRAQKLAAPSVRQNGSYSITAANDSRCSYRFKACSREG